MSAIQLARIVRAALGLAGFGLFMGIRPEFESLTTRAAIAGIGGVVVVVCCLPMRRRHP